MATSALVCLDLWHILTNKSISVTGCSSTKCGKVKGGGGRILMQGTVLFSY